MVRFTPTGLITDEKTLWCVYRVVKVPAGGKTFVRTAVHTCTPAKAYLSKVRIIGDPWDRGPFRLCRSL